MWPTEESTRKKTFAGNHRQINRCREINNTAAQAYAADFGALYRYNDRLDLAGTLTNVGTVLRFVNQPDPLPLALHVAADYWPTPHWNGSVEGIYRKTGLAGVHLGVEWNPMQFVSLRVGYRTDTTAELSAMAGLTTGIGIHLWDSELAYAWLPAGDLGNTQYISFVARFWEIDVANPRRDLIHFHHRDGLSIQQAFITGPNAAPDLRRQSAVDRTYYRTAMKRLRKRPRRQYLRHANCAATAISKKPLPPRRPPTSVRRADESFQPFPEIHRVLESLYVAGSSSARVCAFNSAPGPVQNVQVLPIYNHSVEVLWDAPANAAEIKAYYLTWVATDGSGAGTKLVPPDTPNMAQVQALDPAKVYAITISPVDTAGNLAAAVTLTDIRAQGTFELEIGKHDAERQSGFLFLPQNGLPNQRTDITKLSNDVEPTVQFTGDPSAPAFDFAAIANNGQDHWHWAGVRVGQGSFTTRLKGALYIGDGGTRTLQFDNDTGPFGARAWYVVLSPTKMDRFNLIPNGRDDDSPISYPSELVRIKVVHENATVSRYHQNAKVTEIPFDWRKKAYINARQRLRLDINKSGVTFMADTDYTGTPQVIGTFGTDLSSWTTCYVYFVMGMYTPNENSRAGYNYVGTPTQQDALALFHWGNVSFTAPAGHAPPTELSYFKDPEIGVRAQTRFDPGTPFTITVDALTADVVGRELIFMDATTWPGCDIPGAAENQALSNANTQVLINGTALPNPTPAQVQYDAPAHRYFIPAGVLKSRRQHGADRSESEPRGHFHF